MQTTIGPGIRNIIFDLGGVILNIDYKKTESAFVNLGLVNFHELYTQFHASELFIEFETGRIPPSAFMDELRNHSPIQLSDMEITNAWNAMLLDFPPGRLNFMFSLQSRYRTFLCSNTNLIHHTAIHENYREIMEEEKPLDDCFENSYYSHQVGLRKPDKAMFEYILEENKLVAAETLFIDDTLANAESSELAGIHGLYLKPGVKIEALFS